MTTAMATIASNLQASEDDVKSSLKAMIISAKGQHGAKATDAELMMVSSTCAKYQLNPMVKEMAAFISGGKLQMLVMIDGWYKIVNRQPDFDGSEFVDNLDDKGKIVSITCKMFIKNRSRPVMTTEYMNECFDPKSSVWKRWPNRMLRHKAYIQCARMAFGISEFVDEDERDRMTGASAAGASGAAGAHNERDITPTDITPTTATDDSRAANDIPEMNQDDIDAVDQAMSETTTEEELREVSTGFRKTLESAGAWDANKSKIIKLNKLHSARIKEEAVNRDADSLAADMIEDAQIVEADSADAGSAQPELDEFGDPITNEQDIEI